MHFGRQINTTRIVFDKERILRAFTGNTTSTFMDSSDLLAGSSNVYGRDSTESVGLVGEFRHVEF